MTAGAERVYFSPDEKEYLIERGALREGDVLLLVNPALFNINEYRRAKEACEGNLQFQIAGGEVVDLKTDADFKSFRRQKSALPNIHVAQSIGRPKSIKYTIEQADAIIRLWHDVPRRKPADICRLADAILSLDEGTIKHHWVRDLVRKYAGTAQRDKPAGWSGVRID